MNKHNAMQENSLMFVIVNQGKGSKVLDCILGMGIHGATAFHARGTLPNHILKLLELADVRKEIIMFAMPTCREKEVLEKLVTKFRFDQPNKGIVFTVKLSGVYGSRFLKQQVSLVAREEKGSDLQAVMTIVDKGNTDRILEYMEEQGFPRGSVIDAHGSANKSNKIFDLMFESEKDIFLTITTRNEAYRLARLLTDYLNLETSNSGILAILNLQKAIGITLTLQMGIDEDEPAMPVSKPGHSAIFAIVENDRDEAVIQSAELAGSTGGTIIHARGSCSFCGKNSMSRSVEEEREIVMIIAKDEKMPDLCHRITTDLELDQPGKGILMVVPLYDTVGLVTCR